MCTVGRGEEREIERKGGKSDLQGRGKREERVTQKEGEKSKERVTFKEGGK